MAKPDFRKTLRAIAVATQDANLDRLLSGRTVGGGTVLPRFDEREVVVKGRARRVRLFGIRVSVKDLSGKVGVKTGAMLNDVTRRGNIKVGRVSFKIIPSPEMRARWFAFQAGTKKQPPRPTSGMTDLQIELASAQIAFEGRNQFVKIANSRRRG